MNRIIIERNIDGYTFKARALYNPAEDAWACQVMEGKVWQEGPLIETRDGETDAWTALIDMIDLALSTARQRDTMIAGPFSNAQCQ